VKSVDMQQIDAAIGEIGEGVIEGLRISVEKPAKCAALKAENSA